MTSASLIHEAEHSKLVLWTSQSDGVGRKVGGVGGGFWMGEHMYTHS